MGNWGSSAVSAAALGPLASVPAAAAVVVCAWAARSAAVARRAAAWSRDSVLPREQVREPDVAAATTAFRLPAARVAGCREGCAAADDPRLALAAVPGARVAHSVGAAAPHAVAAAPHAVAAESRVAAAAPHAAVVVLHAVVAASRVAVARPHGPVALPKLHGQPAQARPLDFHSAAVVAHRVLVARLPVRARRPRHRESAVAADRAYRGQRPRVGRGAAVAPAAALRLESPVAWNWEHCRLVARQSVG